MLGERPKEALNWALTFSDCRRKGQWFKQSLWAGGILFTNMLKKSERRQGEERAGL